MKNLFIVLMLMSTVAADVEKESRPDWKGMPLAVPANEKDGHQYMIDIDNYKVKEDGKEKTDFAYEAIAVALVGEEVLFGRYETNKHLNPGNCAYFNSRGGKKDICGGEFFLLHENFAKFQRVVVENAAFDEKNCPAGSTLVQYNGFRLILDKPDRSDSGAVHDPKKHTKFIGTWFYYRDEVAYINHHGTDKAKKEVLIDSFSHSQDGQVKGRFEVLCRTNFYEPKLQ